MGGGVEAVKSGYMKSSLVASQSERMAKLVNGEQIVVGKNKWTDGIDSPLVGGDDGGIFMVDADAAKKTIDALNKTRTERDPARVEAALAQLAEDARNGKNMMEASIECAKARVTTGEWSDTLRDAFGEFRPPTGVEGQALNIESDTLQRVPIKVDQSIEKHGYRPRMVVGKPGLDGHSNGAEMIAVAARHAGAAHLAVFLQDRMFEDYEIDEYGDISLESSQMLNNGVKLRKCGYCGIVVRHCSVLFEFV